MEDSPTAPAEVMQLLDDMLAADGYGVIVHAWPTDGVGHARLEVVAHEGACRDCLVPKSMLATVLAHQLPAGILLDENDLLYPADAGAPGH